MNVIVHFLNGNDISIQNYYTQKDYRNDIIVQIDNLFYEIYFYVEDVTKYEIRGDGFFTYPGLVILDEITNEKILNAIDRLIDMNYFDYFLGKNTIPIEDRFIDKMFVGDLSRKKPVDHFSYRLR